MSDTPIYDALVREFQWYALSGRYVMPVLTPVQEWQARQRITRRDPLSRGARTVLDHLNPDADWSN